MGVLELTSENFEEEVRKSEKTVLVDFYADWCGPCKMMSPIIDNIAEELGDSIKVGKVNTDGLFAVTNNSQKRDKEFFEQFFNIFQTSILNFVSE